MSEEGKRPRRPKPPVGSALQYATIGSSNGEEEKEYQTTLQSKGAEEKMVKGQDVLTAKEEEGLTSEMQTGLTASSLEEKQSKEQEALTAKHPDGLTTSSSERLTANGQESKTFTPQNVKIGSQSEALQSKEDAVKKPKIPPHVKQQTIYLPKQLALKLKAHAAMTEQDMSEIMTRLVEDYLKKQGEL